MTITLCWVDYKDGDVWRELCMDLGLIQDFNEDPPEMVKLNATVDSVGHF